MKSQLAIELSENAVNFASIEDGVVISIDKFTFKDKIDYRYKEQLNQIFIEKGYSEKSYDEYSLSWYSICSTLLPNNVFAEVKPDELLRLCYSGEIPQDNVDYNRIPELAVVNVYTIPLWVKSFFVVKFPRIVIQHEGSHLLHGIFSGYISKLNISIVIHELSFNLVITNGEGLQFYSQFDFQMIDDLVYHLVYTLQQKNLLNQAGNLTVCSGVGSTDEQAVELKQKLESLKDLKLFKIEINSHLLLNFQTLCV
jgi:hypothetical protein